MVKPKPLRKKFEGVDLPVGWFVQAGSVPHEVTLVKPDEYANQFVTISWKQRTVELGLSGRFRKYRESVPEGRGWRTKLVEMAIKELTS